MSERDNRRGMRAAAEVLAPAGSLECLRAAVAGGADAVYLGLRHFNARGRAANFRRDELPSHVDYLHAHGLRCYVVLNTLVHDDELPKAVEMAGAAWQAGVDAAIIQDLGLWQVLAEKIPGLPRHASTQMSVHDPSQIEELAALGAERVILARELSLAQVRACTDAARARGIETEHFVHGALCYAFSGQCLISNFAGCRSANRGTCAQNCRFDYRGPDGGIDSALSMKDLALIEQVPALIDAGVASFKIEGRLKGPDYVYVVSRAYREAIDAAMAGQPYALDAAYERLKTVFSRGFTASPALGRYDAEGRVQRYAPAATETPDAWLLELDRRAGRALIRSEQAPEPGTGFRFAVGFVTDGMLVTAVDPGDQVDEWHCRVRVGRDPRVPRELPLLRNADQQLQRDTQRAIETAPFRLDEHGQAVAFTVAGTPGTALRVSARTDDGREAVADSESLISPASKRPLDEASLWASLGACGGSGFRCASIDVRELAADCFLPARELKQLRRSVLAALTPRTIQYELPDKARPLSRSTGLWVAVGSVAAAEGARAAGAERVWFEGEPVELLPPGCWLRHPPTCAPDERILAHGAPVVAGHLGVLRAARARGRAVSADFHLNVFNNATIDALAELGAEAITMSLECSCREIARVLARRAARPQPAVAVVVHGRLPAMITWQDHGLARGEQRELAAVERDGGLGYTLERRAGQETILWEARTLCAPEQVIGTAGLVDAWVLELGGNEPEQVGALVGWYRDLLAGSLSPSELRQRCAVAYPKGLFPGHLHQGSRELDRVMALDETEELAQDPA